MRWPCQGNMILRRLMTSSTKVESRSRKASAFTFSMHSAVRGFKSEFCRIVPLSALHDMAARSPRVVRGLTYSQRANLCYCKDSSVEILATRPAVESVGRMLLDNSHQPSHALRCLPRLVLYFHSGSHVGKVTIISSSDQQRACDELAIGFHELLHGSETNPPSLG